MIFLTYTFNGDSVDFKIGDLVTRASHNHDTVFEIIDITDDIAYLKGINIRLLADSEISDLKKCESKEDLEDEEFISRSKPTITLDRNDYFYLPGKILHIDGDLDYLNRCLKYYEENNILAIGVEKKEDEIAASMKSLLEEYNPSIVVITGHDAYYKKKGDIDDLKSYRNSLNIT